MGDRSLFFIKVRPPSHAYLQPIEFQRLVILFSRSLLNKRQEYLPAHSFFPVVEFVQATFPHGESFLMNYWNSCSLSFFLSDLIQRTSANKLKFCFCSTRDRHDSYTFSVPSSLTYLPTYKCQKQPNNLTVSLVHLVNNEKVLFTIPNFKSVPEARTDQKSITRCQKSNALSTYWNIQLFILVPVLWI